MLARALISCAVVAVLASAEHWALTDGGITCVILDANVTGTLKVQNEQNVTQTIQFGINSTSKVAGNCNAVREGKSLNDMVVSFYPSFVAATDARDGDEWKLYFSFAAGDKETTFKLVDYTLETSSAFFNLTSQNFTKSTTAELDVEASGLNAFKCSTTGLALSDDSTLELKNVRVIAKARLTTSEFPKEQVFEQCFLDARTSDIVPIVVGACLAGLVVIVLIAYLIGRARAKRQGYASV